MLDRFLHESAHQAVVKGLSKTDVPSTRTTRRPSAATIRLPRHASKLARYPFVSCARSSCQNTACPLVARLPVSEQCKKQGIGLLMLFDATTRCARGVGDIRGVATSSTTSTN